MSAQQGARTRTARRPQVGASIVGATGVERVVQVGQHGRTLLTADAIGRVWARERDADGTWLLA